MSDTADLIGAITNLGKGAWDIVQDGKAKSGAKSAFCSAVPTDIKFTELYGWKTKTGTWKRIWETWYGLDVIEYELTYSFQYGGMSDKAPGAVFVNNFSVWCKSVSVMWGFSISIDASVKGQPYNSGSKKNVIGAIPLLISANAGGSNSLGETMLLEAHGDGSLKVS